MSEPRTFLLSSPVPVGCPRKRDGGDGPRACSLVACPSHVQSKGSRGPEARGDRVRLVVLSSDACARDVGARVRKLGVELTFSEIGAKLGTSPQSARATFTRALAKLRRALGG